MPMLPPFDALAVIATAVVILGAEYIEAARQQIDCEIRFVSLKDELKEFLMTGIDLLDHTHQMVDRVSLVSVFIFLLFCLVFTSFMYVCVSTFIWKQRSHLDLLLGTAYLLSNFFSLLTHVVYLLYI